MQLSPTERLDAINIGLMLFSCMVAMIIPFETFLFSYAILGPLHYLTEISWLHDKKYYTKGKYDALALLIIGFLITLVFLSGIKKLELEFPAKFALNLAYIAFLSALVFTFVKSTYVRIAGILLIILTSQLGAHFELFFGVFLPTLIHVYVFTGLFMLYGALKSKSRLGVAAVVVLALCPLLLVFLFPNTTLFPVTEYGKNAYVGHGLGFSSLNQMALHNWLGFPGPAGTGNPAAYWIDAIFHSRAGILLMRFIAFAYTYHYLNWFSKTRIIQWHKVPKSRFALVLLFWVVSVGLYAYDYMVGLIWLFFLSYLHVLLEFPLNYTSIIGIGRYFKERIFKPTVQRA